MKRLIGWFVDHRVAANLLMGLLLIGGGLMIPNLQQEVFPEVQLPLVNVQVPYPGATPEEVEEGIILAVEDAVRGIDGVKEVRSVAAEGLGVVSAELLLSTDENQKLSDIESAVDRITSFPEDAEEPVISLASNRRKVVSLILHGDAPEATLRELAEQSRRDLLADSRVTYVELSGVRPPEISVELDQETLRRHGLTAPEVAALIRQSSVQVPGGEVEGEGGEVLVRTDARRDVGDEVGAIPLLTGEDGGVVRLRDLGEVDDGFRDTDTVTLFDGEPAARVDVFRVGDETPVEVAAATREHVEALRGELPRGIGVNVWGDQSEIFSDRLALLVENGLIGLGLVILLLGLFLQPRLAFWVTLGLPISFFGAFLLLPATNVSINIISLFAFIVTLGLVVDDAIIVGEAIHYRKEKGLGARDAAIRGATDVARPVIFAVTTTCVAFAPMFFVPGVTGKLFANIPTVVVFVLLCSLIESLLILPAHLSEPMPRPLEWLFHPLFWILDKLGSKKVTGGLEKLTEKIYRPLVERTVRSRYLAMAVGVALLMGTVGLFVGERIDFRFLPEVQDEEVAVSIELPVGTPVETTRAVVERASEAAREAAESEEDAELVRGIFAQVGTTAAQQQSLAQQAASSGGHLGAVTVDLGPGGQRSLTSKEFVNAWREAIGDVAGAEALTFRFSAAASGGKDIDLRVGHPDQETLRSIGSRLVEELRSYAGVRDVDDGFAPGKEQLELRLNEHGRALGLTDRDLAGQVRGAFYGAEAVRQQRGRDELRIYARLPESERRSSDDVYSLVLRTPRADGEMLLADAAEIERTTAPTTIERVGGERITHLTGNVYGDANANDVTADLRSTTLAELQREYPELTVSASGRQEDQQEALSSLATGFGIALFVIFALLAVTFRDYLQPLVVMGAIPFGVIGAVAGHVLLGYDLSLPTVFGLTALAGVMVNDSLLLVVTANDLREQEGLGAKQAVVRAGMRRFRPILLTSMTTFLGLAPMIFETSVQARFLIPMALSLGFGLLFATLIIVFLVPAFYIASEDAKGLTSKALDKLFGERSEGEPSPAE